jgi:hypothetical protein
MHRKIMHAADDMQQNLWNYHMLRHRKKRFVVTLSQTHPITPKPQPLKIQQLLID